MQMDTGTVNKMKQVLHFKPHSTIDVITNSSSELFVCDCGRDINAVEDMLQDMLDLHNKMFDEDRTFNDCFGDIYKIKDEDEARSLIDKVSYFSYNNKSFNAENYVGNIVIESDSDNSIPFELFDLIESGFNARRIHLG